MVNDKPRHRRDIQCAKIHRPLAEPLGEKSPQVSAVIRHRGGSQPAFDHQVLLVLALQPAEWSLVDHWCRRGDDAERAEMGDKLPDRDGLAPLQLPEACAVMDERTHKLVVQLGDPAPAPSHPLIDVSEKRQLRARRRCGVPAPGEMRCERVKMRAKNSRS